MGFLVLAEAFLLMVWCAEGQQTYYSKILLFMWLEGELNGEKPRASENAHQTGGWGVQQGNLVCMYTAIVAFHLAPSVGVCVFETRVALGLALRVCGRRAWQGRAG